MDKATLKLLYNYFMEKILNLIKSNSRYQRNIEFGEPRSGHPEGKVKFHIKDLEANLEKIKARHSLSDEYYWKLMFLIHVHDTFKAEVKKDSPILYERNHATLAREFARQYTDDTDLLQMLKFHDMNYKLWKEYRKTGLFNVEELQTMLQSIVDWDLFLLFIIIDGCVVGKDYSKIPWFINEVRKYRATIVDASWALPLPK